jgi:hypothetical protein
LKPVWSRGTSYAAPCTALESWYVCRHHGRGPHGARFLKQSEKENILPDNSIEQRTHGESAGVFLEFAAFIRRYVGRILGISALVLVPCFWHRTIVASDLGSHVYNAWLAQLVHHGQAPGLWLDSRWNNVLFDYLLDFLGRFFSLAIAEKISVSFSVLVFFWGVFAFVCAATRRAPWFLVPCIAMVSYGYTFHMGFLNYYLSLGLGFWGVAIFWRGRGWERLVPLLFAPVILLANPLGLAWMVAASAYVLAAERIPRRYQFLLMLGAVALLGVAHWHFWHANVIEEQRRNAFYFNGTDQFLLFGTRYWIPQILFGICAVGALVFDLFSRRDRKNGLAVYSIPLQFYVILIFAAGLLPEGIRFANQPVALAILTERLSTVTAAILCCLLGVMVPRKWHLVAFVAIAAIFFGFLYQDTGKLDRMEAQLETLVRTIPANQRVLGTIQPFSGSRILIQHMLDRACIGYCFSYGNYEAASQQFRVRANQGNPYLMTYFEDTSDMEDGAYEVTPEDLPAWQVYQCIESGADLCIAPLRAGQMNDELGVHPD